MEREHKITNLNVTEQKWLKCAYIYNICMGAYK